MVLAPQHLGLRGATHDAMRVLNRTVLSLLRRHEISHHAARSQVPGGTPLGMYELASGPEVSGYFDRVMNQRRLPSGRVRDQGRVLQQTRCRGITAVA